MKHWRDHNESNRNDRDEAHRPTKRKGDELESDYEAGELSHIVGTLTGEADRDTLPGGWEGTDDATSTAPSDLSPRPVVDPNLTLDAEEAVTGRAFGGGLGTEAGGISDITGSPVEESRDWIDDPIVPEEKEAR